MNRTDIVTELMRFETTHAVDSFTYAGEQVWPSLRVWVGSRLEDSSDQAVAPPRGAIRAQVRKARRRLMTWLAEHRTDRTMNQQPGDDADVVLVTHSSRRTTIDDVSHHPWADPLRRELDDLGRQFLSLEAGPPVAGRAMPSAWIDSRLRREIRQAGNTEEDAEPAWFHEFSRWAADLIGRSVPWATHRQRFDLLFRRARAFERWLAQSQPAALFVDCWYNWAPCSAVLAAHWLGIRTVEFQHGLQSADHYGYNSWTCESFRTSQLVPRTFWLWGNENARLIDSTHRFPPRTVVGGNLWLNSAVAETGTRSEAPRILVTTQPAADSGFLEDVVRITPADWEFRIRLHPKERDQAPARETSLRLINPNVSVVDATNRPLYSLLREADVHCTAFSTCTLEALAFGVPSVLWSENGHQAFRALIDSGVATASSPDAAQMVGSIASMLSPDHDSVRSAASQYFATKAAGRVLRELLATSNDAARPVSTAGTAN